MILTRLCNDPADSLLHHQPPRFADPRFVHCGDSDKQLIEAALEQVNAMIVRAAHSLDQYPSHLELQRSFARLVGQRDALAVHLTRCSAD